MALDSVLNNLIEVVSALLLVVLLVGLIHLYLPLGKRIKFFISILIVIFAAYWVLKDMGQLDYIMSPLNSFLKAHNF